MKPCPHDDPGCTGRHASGVRKSERCPSAWTLALAVNQRRHLRQRATPEGLEYSRAASRKRYRRRVDELIELLGGRCTCCGVTEQLQFDHVNWRTKVETITNLVANGPVEALGAEVAKCQLLCAEHHAEKTVRDREEQKAEKTAREAPRAP